MQTPGTGVVKELLYGAAAAAICFAAPSVVNYVFPEPTAIHKIVDEMPFLGFLFIGLTMVRISQRRKILKHDSTDSEDRSV